MAAGRKARKTLQNLKPLEEQHRPTLTTGLFEQDSPDVEKKSRAKVLSKGLNALSPIVGVVFLVSVVYFAHWWRRLDDAWEFQNDISESTRILGLPLLMAFIPCMFTWFVIVILDCFRNKT